MSAVLKQHVEPGWFSRWCRRTSAGALKAPSSWTFHAVGEGRRCGSIARHAKASERGIRILCDFLVINGVLAKENGKYKHTPSAAFLDRARQVHGFRSEIPEHSGAAGAFDAWRR